MKKHGEQLVMNGLSDRQLNCVCSCMDRPLGRSEPGAVCDCRSSKTGAYGGKIRSKGGKIGADGGWPWETNVRGFMST